MRFDYRAILAQRPESGTNVAAWQIKPSEKRGRFAIPQQSSPHRPTAVRRWRRPWALGRRRTSSDAKPGLLPQLLTRAETMAKPITDRNLKPQTPKIKNFYRAMSAQVSTLPLSSDVVGRCMDSAPHFPVSAPVTRRASALGTGSQRGDWGSRSGQWPVEATAKPNVVRYRSGRACLSDP